MDGNSLEGFWKLLEFKLSQALEKTNNPGLKGFWCDGIYLPATDPQLEKKYINDKRKITMQAWLGKSGQDVYDATILFGRKAQSLYARNLPLTNSIPSDDDGSNWFEIDVEKKQIEICLK